MVTRIHQNLRTGNCFEPPQVQLSNLRANVGRENYHQRAQVLTKDYQKSFGVGHIWQVCHLLQTES